MRATRTVVFQSISAAIPIGLALACLTSTARAQTGTLEVQSWFNGYAEVTLNSREVLFGAKWQRPDGTTELSNVEWSEGRWTVRVPLGRDWELSVNDPAGLCTDAGFRSLVDQLEPLGLKTLHMFCGGKLDPRIAVGELARLTSLESLSIDFSNAMGAVLAPRAPRNDRLGFERWSTLKKLRKLAILGIESSDSILACDEEIRALVADHPELEELRLASFGDLTDAGLKHISRLEWLRVLSLEVFFLINPESVDSLYPRITDVGIAHLRSLRNLRVLFLQGCDRVGDASLASIAQMQSLKELTIERNSRITGQGLASLARLPGLQSLDLFKCPGLDDDGLREIAAIQSLRVLDISQCPNITARGAEALCWMKALRKLIVRGGSPVTSEFNRRRCVPECDIDVSRSVSSAWPLPPPLGRR